MSETVQALGLAAIERFPLSLLACVTLAILAVEVRVLRWCNLSADSGAYRAVYVFWTWPIYLWGLETIGMVYGLLFGGRSCCGIYDGLLPEWQIGLFCSMYCLVVVCSAVYGIVRIGLDTSPRCYFNGPLGWSLRLSVFSVLTITCGMYVFWFRLG